MELNITVEQKKAALENAESNLSLEAFNLLVRIGIDPDVFEESEAETMSIPGYEGEIMRLKTILASLSSVRTKLISLG